MAERMKVLSANRFELYFGKWKLGFSRASGLEDSVDYDTYAEGGDSQSPRLFLKQGQQPHILTLEKGAQLRPLLGDTVKLLPGTYIGGGIGLTICDEGQKHKRQFAADWAMIVKWELSQLDATANEVLIERVEIAHSGLREVSAG